MIPGLGPSDHEVDLFQLQTNHVSISTDKQIFSLQYWHTSASGRVSLCRCLALPQCPYRRIHTVLKDIQRKTACPKVKMVKLTDKYCSELCHTFMRTF